MGGLSAPSLQLFCKSKGLGYSKHKTLCSNPGIDGKKKSVLAMLAGDVVWWRRLNRWSIRDF
jgi:hypothetical protein